MVALAAVLVGLATSGRAASTPQQYTITNVGTLGGSYCAGYSGQNSFAMAVNDSGQVAGGSCKTVFGPFGVDRFISAFMWTGDSGIVDLGQSGTAYGSNAAGNVVGSSKSPGFESTGYAFLWKDGTLTNLGPILGDFSAAYDINNKGQVVGIRGTLPNIASWRAFSYDTGTGVAIDLGNLGGSFRSTAAAINDNGDVAGWSSLPNQNTFHAFLWKAGTMTDLGSLGGQSYGVALNASDQVVGAAGVAGGGQHAFLWSGGVMSDLGTLGGTFSYARGINDGGSIVGYALTSTNAQRAVIWNQGTIHDLNDLIPANSGWTLRDAAAINTSGQIVGTGLYGGEERAFLLTPIGDFTPPIISVPSPISEDATTPQGTTVDFTAIATDENPTNPAVTCTPASGSVFPIGDTNVTCTATDAAENIGTASFTVTVRGAPEQLATLLHDVQGVGPGTSLADKVTAAQAAYTAGDPARTCEILNAFINQVKAQTGKSITDPDTADTLIAEATRIRAVLGC